MKIGLLLGIILSALALAACGSDSENNGNNGQEITCDWFKGQNCFKTFVETAKPCAHDSTQSGTLNADGTKCTFTDGTEITFDNPLDLANMDDYEWSYEIKKAGSSCMSKKLNDATKTITFTTSAGTFSYTVSGMAMNITCPDGSKFTFPNLINLMSCEDNLFDPKNVPGEAANWTSTTVNYSIIGSTEGKLPLFTCKKS